MDSSSSALLLEIGDLETMISRNTSYRPTETQKVTADQIGIKGPWTNFLYVASLPELPSCDIALAQPTHMVKGSLQNTMKTITLEHNQKFITSEHHVSHHFRTQPKNRTSWLLTGAALWEVTRSKAMCVPKKGAI